MAPYWIFWVLAAAGCLASLPRDRWTAQDCGLIWLVCTLAIGLRDRVGGDWETYQSNLDLQAVLSFGESLQSRDPAYAALSWIGVHWGGGVTLVNLVCAGLFAAGLVLFCRAQPQPWLAFSLALPYLVIVVAMGYTRQAVAIGLAMPGLLALARGRLLAFIAWIAAATTFHSSALVMLVYATPLVLGNDLLANLTRVGLIGGTGWGLYNAFLAQQVSYFQSGYIDAGYQSEGAQIRVLMNLLPALLFLLLNPLMRLRQPVRRLWFWLSLTAVALAVWLLLSPSSTAVDRIGLYLIPLQLMVGSHLPETAAFGLEPDSWKLLVLLFTGAVLFVWLNFATHAFAWLPYRNLLLPF